MKFLELKSRLAELARDPRYSRARPEGVWFDLYDHGRNANPEDRWHLRDQGGYFLVSWLERGEFAFTERFDTEDDACAFLLAKMSTTPPPAGPPIPDDEINAIGEAMRARYAKDLEAWPEWPEEQPDSDPDDGSRSHDT